MIPITGFLPDADSTSQGVILDADSIIPTVRGSYKSAPSMENAGIAALSSECLGIAALQMLDNSTRVVAGTDTGLFEASGAVWNDVSKAGGYATGTKRWHFGMFGNITLACNGQDPLQASDSGADFADVAGSPSCQVFDVSQGFVMMGATDEGTYGFQGDRWWCSAIYDYTDWTPDVATQATTGRLVDSPGSIRAMKALGASFIAYKDNAMFVGSYVGTPLVWTWQLLPTSIGASSQGAVAKVPSVGHIFIGQEDIYVFDGSGLPQPIGTGIKEWFFADLAQQYKNNIYSVVDKRNSNVWFFYPRNDSDEGNPTGAIIYNWRARKWGVWRGEVQAAVEFITGDITFDTVTGIFDDTEIAFDSPFWTNSTDIPSVVDATNTVRMLTGNAIACNVTFGDVGDDVMFTRLGRVKMRFLQAPTSATMTHQHKRNLGDSLINGTTSTMRDNKFDFLKSARWHRVTTRLVGDCEFSAVAYDLRANGIR